MSAIQETPVWFSQPDLIPSEDMDMARKSLFANDEAEFASRIAMYVRYRSGGFNDSWVKSHIHTTKKPLLKWLKTRGTEKKTTCQKLMLQMQRSNSLAMSQLNSSGAWRTTSFGVVDTALLFVCGVKTG